MVVKEQAKMPYLCWKVCDRARSCCGSESLSNNYTTETLFLVYCSDRTKQLLCFIIIISFCLVKVKKEDKIFKNFFLILTIISLHGYETTKHLRAKVMLEQSHDILPMRFVDFDCSNTKSDKPVLDFLPGLFPGHSLCPLSCADRAVASAVGD